MWRPPLRAVLAISMFAAATGADAVAYLPGFVWDRSTDWTGGVSPGLTAGNPDGDLLGQPVWQYEWTVGLGLAAPKPWYLGPKTLMVWDDDWWGAGGQANWARDYLGPGSDNNVNPPISRYTMAHDLSQYKESWDYMPVVRWTNPTGDAALVDIGGALKIEWAGWGVSPDVDVDVILGIKDSSANSFSLLLGTVVSNPTPGLNNPPYPSVTIPLSFASVRFDEGDSMLVSLRARSAPFALPNWVVLYDDVRLTYRGIAPTVIAPSVPEPNEWAMLAIGLVTVGAAVRRRQRISQLARFQRKARRLCETHPLP